MNTLNTLKQQGRVTNNADVNIQDSQYILNWIAAGGNQHNNNSVTDVWGDNSYNIPNNIISTNFTSKHNNNVSIHDAQYINNWLQGDSSGNSKLLNNKLYKLQEYTYPLSDNWVVLVTHEEVTLNGNQLHKNRLYLKRKNKTDASFNKFILTNSIPYLNLEQGHIIKRENNRSAHYSMHYSARLNKFSSQSSYTIYNIDIYEPWPEAEFK